MVRVAAFAVAAKAQAAVVARICRFAVDPFQQRIAAGFAQRQTVAARIERHAWALRHQTERVETEQHAAAQRIDAADQRGVDNACVNQTRGLRKHFRA